MGDAPGTMACSWLFPWCPPPPPPNVLDLKFPEIQRHSTRGPRLVGVLPGSSVAEWCSGSS